MRIAVLANRTSMCVTTAIDGPRSHSLSPVVTHENTGGPWKQNWRGATRMQLLIFRMDSLFLPKPNENAAHRAAPSKLEALKRR